MASRALKEVMKGLFLSRANSPCLTLSKFLSASSMETVTELKSKVEVMETTHHYGLISETSERHTLSLFDFKSFPWFWTLLQSQDCLSPDPAKQLGALSTPAGL